MARPKVLITRRLPEEIVKQVRGFADVTVRGGAPIGLEDAKIALREYDGIIPTRGDAFSETAFAGDPPLCRVLANFGASMDHISVPAAKAAGIAVTNTPDTVTEPTADIALTLMLMSCRRAGEGERLVRSGEWAGWRPTQMLGMHMSGKTVGIVGMGHVGKAVARRAHFGFNMDVVFFDMGMNEDPGVPARRTETLHETLSAADIVVVTATSKLRPHQTYHMIGTEELAMMKPSAHLINVARGDILDESALIVALEAGQIAGAGLDVYEFEPQVPEELMALENAVLLPHLGTAALDVRVEMGRMAVENLQAVLDGEAPINPV